MISRCFFFLSFFFFLKKARGKEGGRLEAVIKKKIKHRGEKKKRVRVFLELGEKRKGKLGGGWEGG